MLVSTDITDQDVPEDGFSSGKQTIAVCIVDRTGSKSEPVCTLAQLAIALADATWVGSPACALSSGELITPLPSAWTGKLAHAMSSYVYRGADAREDIARCADELAKEVWPMAVSLWEARLIAMEACAPAVTPQACKSKLRM